MKISKAAKSIAPSLSRQLFNMAKDYTDVVDLTLGDPDIMPNPVIRRAAGEAALAGKTRYSANAGLIELRERISENFEKEYGLTADPVKNIAVTVGGMEALFLGLACLVDPGDEVILIGPYYVNYREMITMCGGVPMVVNTRQEDGFSVSAQQLEAAVTDKTVGIIVNSPRNPTGTVLPRQALEEIARIAKKHDLTVISDEVYRTLLFDGRKYESIITLPDMQQRTLLVDSFSKRFAMTGYRLGYAVGPEELIAAMVKMQENVAACASLPSQYAGITALDQCIADDTLRREFEARRDYIYAGISAIEGLSCVKPEGTFYLFVNIESTGMDGLSFACRLLESQQVAVVPGGTYGEAYSNYIRIAFTMEIPKLRIAVERIRRFMEEIK